MQKTRTTRWTWLATLLLALALAAPAALAQDDAAAPEPTAQPQGAPARGPAEDAAAPAQQQPAAPAADGQENVPPPADGGNGGSGGFNLQQLFLPLMLGVLLLLFFTMGRKQRKEQARQRELLANIKKGDKVVTIGGIRGTIVEVREGEVNLKVDEGSNTRIWFSRGAIARTQADETAAAEQQKK